MNRAAFLGLCIAVASAVHAAGAQRPDTTGCDSIVAASRVDTVPAGLFIKVERFDGGDLQDSRADIIGSTIATAFIQPRPFRLSTFSGPALTRNLRPVTGDSISGLRQPTLTGIYRFMVHAEEAAAEVQVKRESLMIGFDSAAIEAIRVATLTPDTFQMAAGESEMDIEVRLTTDSSAGARRMNYAFFPRVRVVDAVPRRDNPIAAFPEIETQLGTSSGEVVFRFVVLRSGEPDLGTVEVVRATSMEFVRSAFVAMAKQRFAPATILGCTVDQRVEYPFTFVQLNAPSRHRARSDKHGFRRLRDRQ